MSSLVERRSNRISRWLVGLAIAACLGLSGCEPDSHPKWGNLRAQWRTAHPEPSTAA